MKKERLRVEIIPDTIAGNTRTLVWDSSTLLEHKIIKEKMHDTPRNRELVLASYYANK